VDGEQASAAAEPIAILDADITAVTRDGADVAEGPSPSERPAGGALGVPMRRSHGGTATNPFVKPFVSENGHGEQG
jgi:hypothetical protein